MISLSTSLTFSLTLEGGNTMMKPFEQQKNNEMFVAQSTSLDVQQALNKAVIEAQLSTLPYGDSPLLKMSIPLHKEKEIKNPALDLR
jgi:hypothetical protein